jgi:hypothetical protein
VKLLVGIFFRTIILLLHPAFECMLPLTLAAVLESRDWRSLPSAVPKLQLLRQGAVNAKHLMFQGNTSQVGSCAVLGERGSRLREKSSLT